MRWFGKNNSPQDEVKQVIEKVRTEYVYHQGWQCPICKTVYSPIYKTCLKCNGNINGNRPYYQGPSCGNVVVNESHDIGPAIIFGSILHDDNNYIDTPSISETSGGGGDFGGGGSSGSYDDSSSSGYSFSSDSSDYGSSDCGSSDCGGGD